jgi:hypothetical protein
MLFTVPPEGTVAVSDVDPETVTPVKVKVAPNPVGTICTVVFPVPLMNPTPVIVTCVPEPPLVPPP